MATPTVNFSETSTARKPPTASVCIVHTPIVVAEDKHDTPFLLRRKRTLVGFGVFIAAVVLICAVTLTAGGSSSAAPPPSPSSMSVSQSQEESAAHSVSHTTTTAPTAATTPPPTNTTSSAPAPEVERFEMNRTTQSPSATNAPTTTKLTPKPTTAAPSTTSLPTTARPATTATTTAKPTTTSPSTTAASLVNDNGSGLWGGSIKLINNLKKVCIYTDKTATYFTPDYGRGDLGVGDSVTFGPFGGSYTLGVQENVFAKCAYAGSCAWDNHSADNYCYNFSLDKKCAVSYNDCPWPAGNPSPAPDGRKRYTITGSVNPSTGVCVISVNGSSTCAGDADCYCSASLS
ncbi:hypothetical protein Ae201684P_011819 [Aphanomyces euteiches]|uniref:Uncharacterized protein n=1 Tax=Aphanomyces euteiches TaxID=100861 RepID=A0A6G0WUN2_9STRA|nr:hypothetical protein Ae201684_011432 [Aphanomyces euteiches]KAH9097090.1 hypothetical protein Ae201684P_011819 [Aphanomyces euteiches]KAH9152106.1 hypothetical protein AeRB84_005418 [Aphanomyces euteiches]